MVVETWLTPQNDRKTWFRGIIQANYTHATVGSDPKMHFLYLKNHSTYEIGQLLKITALFNFLIVSYSLEFNNSNEKKWNHCYFYLLLQVLNTWFTYLIYVLDIRTVSGNNQLFPWQLCFLYLLCWLYHI